MEEITEFGMLGCLSLSGLGWKNFSSLRTEEDEPLYTYNDKCMRWFIRQNIRGRRVCAFNQYCKLKKCDAVLKILSEELKIKGNTYDIIEANMTYKNIRTIIW